MIGAALVIVLVFAMAGVPAVILPRMVHAENLRPGCRCRCPRCRQ